MQIIDGAKLTPEQLKKTGELLFLTDPEIYPTAFGSAENTGEVFPLLTKIERGLFAASNILVAISEKEDVCGVLVGCNGNVWEKGTLARVFEEKGIELPFEAEDAEDNYFVYEAEHEKGDYVLCLCVSPLYRRKNVARRLLEHYLTGKREVSLECLADNPAALALYKSVGFCVESEYDGYSAPATPPVRVVRMIYRA